MANISTSSFTLNQAGIQSRESEMAQLLLTNPGEAVRIMLAESVVNNRERIIRKAVKELAKSLR